MSACGIDEPFQERHARQQARITVCGFELAQVALLLTSRCQPALCPHRTRPSSSVNVNARSVVVAKVVLILVRSKSLVLITVRRRERANERANGPSRQSRFADFSSTSFRRDASCRVPQGVVDPTFASLLGNPRNSSRSILPENLGEQSFEGVKTIERSRACGRRTSFAASLSSLIVSLSSLIVH